MPSLASGPDRALRVGLGDLLEELAGRQPLLLLSSASLPRSKRNWSGCVVPRRNGAAARASRCARRRRATAQASGNAPHAASCRSHSCVVSVTAVSSATRCSAASPCSSPTRGREPQVGPCAARCRHRCAACRLSARPAAPDDRLRARDPADHLEHLVDASRATHHQYCTRARARPGARPQSLRSPHRPRT